MGTATDGFELIKALGALEGGTTSASLHGLIDVAVPGVYQSSCWSRWASDRSGLVGPRAAPVACHLLGEARNQRASERKCALWRR